VGDRGTTPSRGLTDGRGTVGFTSGQAQPLDGAVGSDARAQARSGAELEKNGKLSGLLPFLSGRFSFAVLPPLLFTRKRGWNETKRQTRQRRVECLLERCRTCPSRLCVATRWRTLFFVVSSLGLGPLHLWYVCVLFRFHHTFDVTWDWIRTPIVSTEAPWHPSLLSSSLSK
jgi:hypothetical protein